MEAAAPKKTATKKKKPAATGAKGKAKKAATRTNKKASKPVQGATRLKSRRTILKGPSSAWIMFSNAERENLKTYHPNLDFGQQSQILSRKWKEMTEAQKQPYKLMHQEDRKRFLADKANLSEDDLKMLRTHKRNLKIKKKDRPRAGLSAYMFFVKSRRKELLASDPNLKFDQIGKRLGEIWATMDTAARAPFEQQSSEDKARQSVELQKWQQQVQAQKVQHKQQQTASAASSDLMT